MISTLIKLFTKDYYDRRKEVNKLPIQPVIKSVCPECKGEPTTINTVRYFFCEKCKKVGQTVL
jgi:ribosomal protein L37AE/L43A